MTTPRERQQKTPVGGATGYESDLWRMADALRGSMDAAEYKHVVLGLIFLKYISDAFQERHAELVTEVSDGADPEDPDEYRAKDIFWVPGEARWPNVQAHARQPTIGQAIDAAMAAVERENPALRDVLPKDYAREALDKQRLGRVIDLVSNIKVGGAEAQATDVLGRVYEYFLGQFALLEGRKGGEFYTPRSVVRLLVEMLEPYNGRVYDPCCGSSGMFVQSVDFIRAHATGNGNGSRAKGDISIYGQESNYTTWRLAKMNLALRGIEGQVAHGDSFHNDRHPDLRADYILANPPFNVSDWGGDRLRNDKRWVHGVPPVGNANFAWVQHFLHHLAPRGTAGFVLANGSMSSNQSGEGEIRKSLIEANLSGLHRRPAWPAVPVHPDSRLPLVPGAGPQGRQAPGPPGRDPLHRHPQAGPHGGPHPPGADRRRHRPHRRRLPRLARRRKLRRVRRRARLLQERVPGGGPQARPRPHPRPLRRRRGAGGRRRALRGEDGPPRRPMARAAGRGRPAGRSHRGESGQTGVWR